MSISDFVQGPALCSSDRWPLSRLPLNSVGSLSKDQPSLLHLVPESLATILGNACKLRGTLPRCHLVPHLFRGQRKDHSYFSKQASLAPPAKSPVVSPACLCSCSQNLLSSPLTRVCPLRGGASHAPCGQGHSSPSSRRQGRSGGGSRWPGRHPAGGISEAKEGFSGQNTSNLKA